MLGVKWLPLLFTVILAKDWKCGFDTLDTDVNLAPQQRMLHERELLDRTGLISPIRIHIEYGALNLSPTLEAYFKTEVMPYALNWFTKTLSVNPVQGKFALPSGTCNLATIPSSLISPGVDADYVLFVYGNNYPTEGFAARAGACLIDPQYRNQVVAGSFELNTYYYDLAYTLEQHIGLVIHELTHALGFASNLYPLYTKDDGTSYAASEVTGTDVKRGKSVSMITLPKVVAEGQAAYACASLTGIELEDAGGAGTAGSHWEKRILYNEYMVGDIGPTEKVFSRITLALFDSTGWYQVDYSHSNNLLWGAGEGCSFLDQKCVISGVAQFPEFCDDSASKCTFNHMHGGYCSIVSYSSALPLYFQYFASPNVGGVDFLADYCPYVDRYSNRNCRDLGTQPNLVIDAYGEEVCLDCRCVEGTFLKDNYVANDSIHASCVRVQSCDSTKATLKVGDATVDCPFTGGVVTIPGFQGTLTCPDSDVLCAEFQCANFCSGAGICQSDGTCNCDEGFFGFDCHNMCSSYCLSCSDATTCLTCHSPDAEVVDGVCQCKSGFIPSPDVKNCVSSSACPAGQKRYGDVCVAVCPADITIDSGDVCYPCDVTCATCAGTVTTCTTCPSPALLHLDTCVVECPNGYFSTNTDCLACDPSCLTCAGSATVCTACPVGKLTNGSSCVDVCPDGTYDNFGSCILCFSSCLTCSGSSSFCTACAAPLLLYLNACVSSCPSSGYFSNGAECLPCDPTCLACSTSAANCLSCPAGKFLYQNACVDVCPDGTYGNSGVCSLCDASCLTCSGSATSCTSCVSPKVVQDNACVCPIGFFSNGTECLLCDPSCLTCSMAPTNCLSCPAGKFLYQSSCVDVCPDGTYDDSGVCSFCDASCLTCSGSETFCTSCVPPNVVQNNACVSSCPSSGYFRNGAECLPCDPSCLACSTSAANCLSCPAGRLFYQNSCVNVCPDGTYDDSGVCSLCDASCLTCSGSATSCTSCVSPKVVQDNACVCQSGYFSMGNDCELCDPSCLTCSMEPTHCLSCHAGTFLLDNTCDDICPAGTFEGPGVCTPCDASCLTCSGSAAYCTSCNEPKLLSASSCVDTCPPDQTPTNGVCNGSSGCLGDCLTCSTTPSTCTSCKPPTFLYGTTCVNCCPKGYTGVDGVCIAQCHKSCLTCTGPGPEDCSSCVNHRLQQNECDLQGPY
jgi:hypothetical protein